MAKRYDATTKHLVEAHPADWLAFAGLPAATGTAARLVDADVSTVTAAADKVIRVDGAVPYLAHLEFQSSPDPDLDLRAMVYNVTLRLRHRLPVWTAVFLLRPQAAGTGATGRVYATLGDGAEALLDFRYRMVRVWELPPDTILAGGVGTLPLAPITAVAPADVPGVIDRVRDRLGSEVAPAEARELLTATVILLGLRYSRQQVDHFVKGVRGMEESDTYQAILEKGIEKGIEQGRAAEARATLLRVGRRSLGPVNPTVVARVAEIADVGRLEELTDRVLDRAAASWDELLGAES